jgi:deoxyribodipyrimidine photolyase-related protein
MAELRQLVLVLGDQLDLDASAFDGFDPAQDAVWMAEVAEESTHIGRSQRIALFLAAMRHFAELQPLAGRCTTARWTTPATAAAWPRAAGSHLRLRPQRLVMTAPGDWRVLQALRGGGAGAGLPLEVRDDRHFFCTVREFAPTPGSGRKRCAWSSSTASCASATGVLMDGDQPCRRAVELRRRQPRVLRPAGPRPAAAARALVRAGRCHHARW